MQGYHPEFCRAVREFVSLRRAFCNGNGECHMQWVSRVGFTQRAWLNAVNVALFQFHMRVYDVNWEEITVDMTGAEVLQHSQFNLDVNESAGGLTFVLGRLPPGYQVPCPRRVSRTE
jgi:hypothetical protein